MDLKKFKLERLTLKAFEDAHRSIPRSKGRRQVEALFNPTPMKQSLGIEWSRQQAAGGSGVELSYGHTKPTCLEIELLFDGTGLHESGMYFLAPTSVNQRIDQFKEVAYEYNGNIHQPNFLLLEWGKVSFPCRLSSVDITYTLFDRDGTPLRAELALKLLSDESTENLAKKENKSSPDLTHARTVHRGDTLPLLTRDIYGSSTHFLRVARWNGLDHPLDLKPGHVLHFPPLVQLLAA